MFKRNVVQTNTVLLHGHVANSSCSSLRTVFASRWAVGIQVPCALFSLPFASRVPLSFHISTSHWCHETRLFFCRGRTLPLPRKIPRFSEALAPMVSNLCWVSTRYVASRLLRFLICADIFHQHWLGTRLQFSAFVAD